MSKNKIAPVSPTRLQHRRKQLRRQRGLKSVQTGWRLLIVSSLAGGLVWIVTLPDWVIQGPQQVEIEGNQFFSAQKIRELIPLSYPQSLLRLHPKTIARHLESQPPIAQATVRRQLFPPSLTVAVQERYPVAIAYPSGSNLRLGKPSAGVGLIDEEGSWIPWESYQALTPKTTLPTLKVIGDRTRYISYWSQVYQAIDLSPIKIFEIDWQDLANLILKTDLGIVHCGPYSDRFAEQLGILDRMRDWSNQIDPSRIDYIDLSNPDAPSLQVQPESLPPELPAEEKHP